MSWLAPLLVGALALAVRLPNLDHVAHFDELYHFLAAQSWLAEGQLRVADGAYNRTPLFTIFIAQWLGLFGENLVVARLPSLIAGTALVILVFLWTRAVAGSLAAVLAALLLALDPEHLQISQWGRFYTLQCLTFWLGAVGSYRLVTSPPRTPGRAIMLAFGALVCFGAATYLQITTLIGILGVAVWASVALGLPFLARRSNCVRWTLLLGIALLGAVAIWAIIEIGVAAELLDRYRGTPVYQAGNRNEFWYYHAFLIVYYPTLWPLVALAAIIGLAYRPRPTAFCACLVATAFVLFSFAGPKAERYLTFAQPFLFVLWAIPLAEVWPRLRRLLEEVGTRAMAWLGLGRLGRPGMFAALTAVLIFTVVANGAWVRTAANMFDFVIPPMKRQADWAAAKDTLAPWLADAAIVLTTNELSALYYLGRYDVLISRSRLSEYGDGQDFSRDPRTGRPVIAAAESLALIMDCYQDGLIVADDSRWDNRAQVSDGVIQLISARAEELELPAVAMHAFVWRQPEDARRAEACARLPAALSADVTAGLEQAHAR
jgi:4-amino-4-deoxy-L-arabinose transferase-like glycosyltransferase